MKALLRLVLPSWGFFDRPGHIAKLEIQIYGDENSLYLFPEKLQKRRWWHLLLNPSGNDYHYVQSLLNQVLMQSQTREDFATKPTKEFYQLLKWISTLLQPPPTRRVQLKLYAVDWNTSQKELAFETPKITWEALRSC